MNTRNRSSIAMLTAMIAFTCAALPMLPGQASAGTDITATEDGQAIVDQAVLALQDLGVDQRPGALRVLSLGIPGSDEKLSVVVSDRKARPTIDKEGNVSMRLNIRDTGSDSDVSTEVAWQLVGHSDWTIASPNSYAYFTEVVDFYKYAAPCNASGCWNYFTMRRHGSAGPYHRKFRTADTYEYIKDLGTKHIQKWDWAPDADPPQACQTDATVSASAYGIGMSVPIRSCGGHYLIQAAGRPGQPNFGKPGSYGLHYTAYSDGNRTAHVGSVDIIRVPRGTTFWWVFGIGVGGSYL